jgi:uncharacterized protein (TIGR01244 family)
VSDPLCALARALAWGACPLEGILTAGQPTAEQLAALARAGLRTILDVRGSEEDRGFDEPAAARALGLRYEAVPVTPDTLGDEQFDCARAVLNDPAAQPVLVHCRSANRSGALLYPWLVLDHGTDPERAFDLACAVGLRNPGYAEKALAYVEARS